MARVVQVHYLCDRTAAKHPPLSTPGDTLLIWQRDLAKLLEIDICEPCQGRLSDAEAQQIAKEKGREPVAPEVDPDLVCPFGCNGGLPYKSKSGRSKHMNAAHPGDS